MIVTRQYAREPIERACMPAGVFLILHLHVCSTDTPVGVTVCSDEVEALCFTVPFRVFPAVIERSCKEEDEERQSVYVCALFSCVCACAQGLVFTCFFGYLFSSRRDVLSRYL